jgi:hypothetical protein
MPSLGIARFPGGALAVRFCLRRELRRFQASFRRIDF